MTWPLHPGSRERGGQLARAPHRPVSWALRVGVGAGAGVPRKPGSAPDVCAAALLTRTREGPRHPRQRACHAGSRWRPWTPPRPAAHAGRPPQTRSPCFRLIHRGAPPPRPGGGEAAGSSHAEWEWRWLPALPPRPLGRSPSSRSLPSGRGTPSPRLSGTLGAVCKVLAEVRTSSPPPCTATSASGTGHVCSRSTPSHGTGSPSHPWWHQPRQYDLRNLPQAQRPLSL